jgi:hypothetical protein
MINSIASLGDFFYSEKLGQNRPKPEFEPKKLWLTQPACPELFYDNCQIFSNHLRQH